MSSNTIYTCPSQEVRDLIKNYTEENSLKFRHSVYLRENLISKGYSRSEFSRIIYDCRNNIYTQPKCYCGNDLKFYKYSSGYQQYCSKKCSVNSPEIQEKTKQTCLKNHGVEYPMHSPEIQEKSKQTCLKNYGVEHIFETIEFKEKSKQTCLKNYGVEHSMQSPEIQEKQKQTMLENYGVEHALQCPKIHEKSKQTCKQKYGVENPSQSIEVQEKKKQTCLKKYGVEYSLQSPEVQEKRKETMLENYGVEHALQCPKIHEKMQKSGFKLKEHRDFQCQGYEPKAIDFLIDVLNVNPENITTSRSEIHSIKYTFEDKEHVYHPDVLIKSSDILIEVKSPYTWKADYEKNLTKMEASKAILMIFDETSRLPLLYYGDYPDENLN